MACRKAKNFSSQLIATAEKVEDDVDMMSY